MSKAFDRAWSVVKDFYYNPNKLGEGGIARQMRHGVLNQDRYAGFNRTSENEFLQGRGERKVGGMALADQVTMKPMHLRQAGDTTYTAGMNLSAVDPRLKRLLESENPQHHNRAFKDFVEGSDGVAEIMAHEHGHGLMNDDIRGTGSPYRVLSDPDTRSAHEKRAHEIGAYNLQNPGGITGHAYAEMKAEGHPSIDREIYSHKNEAWEKGRIPRPAFYSGQDWTKEEFEGTPFRMD